MFRFAHPELLYLLIVIPLLIVFYVVMIRRKKKAIPITREYVFIAVRSFGLPVRIPRLALKNAAMNTAS